MSAARVTLSKVFTNQRSAVIDHPISFASVIVELRFIWKLHQNSLFFQSIDEMTYNWNDSIQPTLNHPPTFLHIPPPHELLQIVATWKTANGPPPWKPPSAFHRPTLQGVFHLRRDSSASGTKLRLISLHSCENFCS